MLGHLGDPPRTKCCIYKNDNDDWECQAKLKDESETTKTSTHSLDSMGLGLGGEICRIYIPRVKEIWNGKKKGPNAMGTV